MSRAGVFVKCTTLNKLFTKRGLVSPLRFSFSSGGSMPSVQPVACFTIHSGLLLRRRKLLQIMKFELMLYCEVLASDDSVAPTGLPCLRMTNGSSPPSYRRPFRGRSQTPSKCPCRRFSFVCRQRRAGSTPQRRRGLCQSGVPV